MTDESRLCTDCGGLLGGAYKPAASCFLPAGDPPPAESTLEALAEHGHTFLTLVW